MDETEIPEDVLARLKAACVGHPHAKIAWPHRLLHDAIAEIERLRPAPVVPADVQKVAREATMGWMLTPTAPCSNPSFNPRKRERGEGR